MFVKYYPMSLSTFRYFSLSLSDSMRKKLVEKYAPTFVDVLNEPGSNKYKVVVESE